MRRPPGLDSRSPSHPPTSPEESPRSPWIATRAAGPARSSARANSRTPTTSPTSTAANPTAGATSRPTAGTTPAAKVSRTFGRPSVAKWNAERCVHGVKRPDAQAEQRDDDGGCGQAGEPCALGDPGHEPGTEQRDRTEGGEVEPHDLHRDAGRIDRPGVRRVQTPDGKP